MEKTAPIFTQLYKKKVEIKFFPDSHIYMVNGKRTTGVTTYLGIKDKSRPLMSWQGVIIRDYLLALDKITHKDVYAAILQPELKKKEAADLGHEIHAWSEQYIKSKLGEKGSLLPDMPEDQRVANGVMAFLDWELEHKVKFISSERPVYSKKHDYIGTLDIEAMVGKKRCLVDLKSSNGLYNEVRMQTAAYATADTEENGKKYDGRWAIRLSKETEEEFVAKEEAKKQSKRVASEITDTEFKDYQIPEFQVFEAKDLDADERLIERDFKAFLNCKELFSWNKITDKFNNENW